MLKLKMMLRDDVAAGRRRFCTSKQSIPVSAIEATASGVDISPSPDWRTPLNGIISPSEKP